MKLPVRACRGLHHACLPTSCSSVSSWLQGAAGVVDLVLSKRAPSGRTPVSWVYENYTQQIAMSDMAMRAWPGRTHRYLQVRSSASTALSCAC